MKSQRPRPGSPSPTTPIVGALGERADVRGAVLRVRREERLQRAAARDVPERRAADERAPAEETHVRDRAAPVARTTAPRRTCRGSGARARRAPRASSGARPRTSPSRCSGGETASVSSTASTVSTAARSESVSSGRPSDRRERGVTAVRREVEAVRVVRERQRTYTSASACWPNRVSPTVRSAAIAAGRRAGRDLERHDGLAAARRARPRASPAPRSSPPERRAARSRSRLARTGCGR